MHSTMFCTFQLYSELCQLKYLHSLCTWCIYNIQHTAISSEAIVQYLQSKITKMTKRYDVNKHNRDSFCHQSLCHAQYQYVHEYFVYFVD